jgi:uncharacterized protein (TIGR03437 family)
LANPATVYFGNTASGVWSVQWAGIAGAGLWQINVTVPANYPSGDRTLVVTVGGMSTQGSVLLPIVRP